MSKLPRSTPEKQGIPSVSIQGFLEDIAEKNLELHSFMMLRNGHVISEGWWDPYKPDLPHMLFSLSKSFTSTAVGFAVSEGRLSVEDTVLGFFREYTPKGGPSPHLSAMKVKHLLSMSTGHAQDTSDRMQDLAGKTDNWVRAFFQLPVEYEPGTHFVYNSGASYLLSAIVQKLTGQTLLAYLTPRLFQPLGMKSPTWECCPMGINCGGWGLSIRTEDIAGFGQLYLQDGIWKGTRVLPEGWVQEATRFHISNGEDPRSDWSRGYGYQFWRCRHNAYRGDGAFGQFCIVMPDQNAVIAITSGLDDMQSVLDSVWKHLLSAMGKAELPENPRACAQLQKSLHSLALFPPKGRTSSPQALDRTGKIYALEENEPGWERISFEFMPDQCILRLRAKGKGIAEIHCGTGDWMENPEHADWLPGKFMASSVWTEDSVCQITLRFIETPFYFTLCCSFDGKDIRISASRNASFGPKEIPAIHGSIAGV